MQRFELLGIHWLNEFQLKIIKVCGDVDRMVTNSPLSSDLIYQWVFISYLRLAHFPLKETLIGGVQLRFGTSNEIIWGVR